MPAIEDSFLDEVALDKMVTKNTADDTPKKENESNYVVVTNSKTTGASSPDLSLPSAAETSYASSPEDEAKAFQTRRTLFKMEDEEELEYKKVTTIAESTEVRPSPSMVSPNKYETILISHKGSVLSETSSNVASTTSSDTTAVPSWNLSAKDPSDSSELNETFVLAPNTPDNIRSPPSTLGWKQRYHTLKGNFLQSRLSKDPGLVFQEARPFYAKKEADEENASNTKDCRSADDLRTPMMEEVPPEPTASCSSALNLTPAQFAEMFLAFGHNVRERSPHNDNDDATSAAAVASPDREDVVNDGTDHASQLLPSASPMRDENEDEPAGIQTPQTRFLVRENSAFKKIVEQDAHSILTLQRALETQKRLCALKEVEIMDRQKELQISEDRIARLQKEREEKLEREIELMETIRILKLEIDKMTLETGTVFDTTKIASMETELKAQQTHILKLEASLREKEKQNFDLQTETDYLRNQQKETKTHPIVSFDTTTSAEEITLSDQVDQSTEDGMLRSMSSWTDILGDISKRLALLEKEKEEKGTKDQELYEQMNEIRSRLGLGPDKKDMMMFKVTNSPEEIEAIPLAAKAQEKADSSCKYLLCCDWGVVVEN